MSAARSSHGVAGRYASALFELARDGGALEQVEGDLEALSRALEGSEDFRRLTKSPVFSKDDKEKAVAALADRMQASALTKNFLGVLARNRRLFALDDVIEAFRALAADHRGEVRAEATTAVPLDDERIQRLKTEIEAAVGRAVRLDAKVDENLLGGVVVKIGSKMIDSSLRTKLQRLKSAMKGA